MASIPCTVQLRIRTTTSRAAQGQGKGGGGLRTQLLGASDGMHIFNSPMVHSDGVLVDRILNTGKAKKKENLYGVEVVEVKWGNPMSSRLRKLGFPKL